MKKSIVYATTTGNTEAMANAIKQGAENVQDEVYFSTADSADIEKVIEGEIVYLGSPAMGDEVLEDSMEDFFMQIEQRLANKKVAIFGSYDWGDGQWLRDWADRISSVGATLINGEGLKINLSPDEDGLSECKKLGEQK